MFKATCKLKSFPGSPYSPSRAHETEKLEKETAAAWDERTWRQRAHTNPKTKTVVIPSSCFKKAIDFAAAHLKELVPGKKGKTFTDYIASGVMVPANLDLGIKPESLESEEFYCHADGKKRSGTRVWRRFPMIYQWSGTLEVIIIDGTVTEEVFRRHIEAAGLFIGVGRYRPHNGGHNGRFTAEVNWSAFKG